MVVVGTGPFVIGHLRKISCAHLVRLFDQFASRFRVQILIKSHHTLDAKVHRSMTEDIEHPRMSRQHVHAGPSNYYTVVLARDSSQNLSLFLKELLVGKRS